MHAESSGPGRSTRAARALFAGKRALGVVGTVALLVVGVAPLARCFGLALARIRYPFELEWMEGQIVTHVGIVLHGGQVYREPSIEFTPFIYAPFYYYASALVSAFTGLGYFAPRLVSVVSMFVSFVLLARLVKRETDDLVAGMVASGMLAATYSLTCFFLDIARVDSLFLALTLGGYTLARGAAERPTHRFAVAAAGCLALACFSKQVGLAVSLPALVYVFLAAGWRRGLVAAGVFAGLLAVLFGLMELGSHGWFRYYVFDLPSRHEMLWKEYAHVGKDYFYTPTVVLSLASLAVVTGVTFRRAQAKEWALYGGFVLAACATSFSSMLHTGGYPNTLIPAYAAMALAFGLSVGALRRARGTPAFLAIPETALAVALVLLQSTLLDYEDKAALPTEQDLAAGRRVMRALEQLEGPMWMTASSFYPTLAGHPEPGTPAMGPVDVFKAGGRRADALRAELVAQIRAHHYKTIVLDRADGFLPGDIGQVIRQEYRRQKFLFKPSEGNLFWPKSGASIRPDEVWVAK